MPACWAVERDVEVERAGAGARSSVPSTRISTKPRPSRMTTPRTPPSRTSRFEATPITVTGTSAGLAARKAARSSGSAGRNITSAGAADAEPGDGRERRVRAQPAAHRRQPLDQAIVGAARGHHRRPSGGVERLELARQALRPVGDRAGAEADDEVAGLGQTAHQPARARRGRRAPRHGGGRARAGQRPARRG